MTTIIRRLEKRDAPQLSELNREFYKIKRDESFWEWKYYQLPCRQHYMAVAQIDDRIIGQIGCICLFVIIKGERVLCGQTQDILVLEEFRKGRTFFKIERKARNMGVELGSFFDFGFSIELTRKIATGLLGFSDIGRIPKMVRPLNLYPYLIKKISYKPLVKLVSLLLKPVMKRFHLPTRCRLPKDWRIEEVTHFDERFDDLWSEVKDRYPVIVERSSKYLNWRYAEHPEARYSSFTILRQDRPLGFIVLDIKEHPRRFESLQIEYVDAKRGDIVDILVAPGSRSSRVYDLLLQRAFSYFVENDVDVISCWCLPHMDVTRHLQKFYFRQRWTPHHLIVRSYKPEWTANSAIFKIDNWYITRGDSDHY